MLVHGVCPCALIARADLVLMPFNHVQSGKALVNALGEGGVKKVGTLSA
jgi:hypothetical protein